VQVESGAACEVALSQGRAQVRRSRTEKGDDRWGPPVSDRGAADAAGPRWAGKPRRAGCRGAATRLPALAG
jgi:hypothetical protein